MRIISRSFTKRKVIQGKWLRKINKLGIGNRESGKMETVSGINNNAKFCQGEVSFDKTQDEIKASDRESLGCLI